MLLYLLGRYTLWKMIALAPSGQMELTSIYMMDTHVMVTL